ncbi:MAG TPA: GNAT family N-acetyltransferase [Novosphingobium sp.]|nr:GNAT family N-acetyltransferase [Novosphingobium sp.]
MATKAAAAILLRPMTPADIEATTELSREQQWPHREEDWAFFLAQGEGLVAECDGDVVGSVMGWRFGADYATIGMVIVSDKMQGRGLGRRLMEQMIARLDGRSIVLNATDVGLPLYRKLGFVEIGTVCQHQAVAGAMPLAELRPGERVRPTGGADDMLADLYSRAAGMDRSALFDALAADGSTVVLTRDHLPQGFAQQRRFGRGWEIGPVVAPDEKGAKALILHWLGTSSGSFCRLDVTEASGLSPWLEEIGLPKVGQVITMVRGRAPVAGVEASVQALAAQALG